MPGEKKKNVREIELCADRSKKVIISKVCLKAFDMEGIINNIRNICSIISLPSDMETECFPCIPMQSASNQRNSSNRTKQQQQQQQQQQLQKRPRLLHQMSLGGETITIKHEPSSSNLDDVDVVDEDDDFSDNRVTQKDHRSRMAAPAGNSLLLHKSRQQQQQQIVSRVSRTFLRVFFTLYFGFSPVRANSFCFSCQKPRCSSCAP